MNRLELARNLAFSLTMGAWSQAFLTVTLRRRLPSAMHQFVEEMCIELLLRLPSKYAPSANRVAAVLSEVDAFERVFRFCQKWDVWPTPDLRSPGFAPTLAFSKLNLPEVATVSDLADWLFLPVDNLEYLADRHARFEEHGETAINHYHYVLKRKPKGFRVIEAPKDSLKTIQRQVLRGILDKVPVHRNAFGFVHGKDCLQGADKHVGEQVVVCFDLKSFFPSIGAGRVFGLFRCLGYPHAVARYLTALCTTSTPPRILERLNSDDRSQYQMPHLPQGAPSSPALANLLSFGLDCRLTALADSLHAAFTRYADDLSFSGDARIVKPLLQTVPQIASDEGFQINQAKTRVQPRKARQMVTGAVVNEHRNINRKTFDQMKALIHACGKSGDSRLMDPMFRVSLLGKIDWIEAVNPSRGQKLRHLLSAAYLRRFGQAP